MPVIINGSTGITNVNGSASTPAETGTDTDTGIYYGTNTVGLATNGTNALFIDASQNVGIGTSSPAGPLNTVGYVYQDNYASGTALFLRRANGTASSKTTVASGNVLGEALYGGYDGSTYQYTAEILGVVTGAVSSGVVPTALIFSTSATNTAGLTERMRIDSSGNLLVGTTSGGNNARLKSKVTANTYGLEVTDEAQSDFIVAPLSGGVCRVGPSAGAMAFYASNTECARIDSSGNLLVGTTSSGGVGFTVGTDAAGRILTSNVSAVPFDVYLFKNNGTTVGKITINTASTAYTTTSDYRLKENISPISGALDVVSQLKPVNYTWKLSGEATQGFIAHELQAVVPDCVVGEKDAVDAEGNPQYQGVDTSFLVATLTAAIQEQQALITALTARIESLETK